ncbi:MAG: Crp/Fnr family transcriptional regulator [Steroidobacteraceae bacterium]
MTPESLPAARNPSDLQAEAAFKEWVRRLVKGAAERKALEAGQIDAILDPATGSAILLPEARAALRRSTRSVMGAHDVTRKNVGGPKSDRALSSSRRTRAGRIAAVARATTPNCLLAALPAREYERLLDGLEPVRLTYGEVLDEPGEQMRYAYFPCDCLVSLLTVVEGRRALEVGLVGREGMVGSRLALGFTTSSVRALVQGTGTALRMRSAHFLREFERSPALQRTLLRFTDALMCQVIQNAACNRFHVVEARLARWLLMTRERVASPEFLLTHKFIADMLGVRRVGVTLAASALQRRQLIRYRRGAITILDQQGLEASACSCYRQVRLTALAGDPS